MSTVSTVTALAALSTTFVVAIGATLREVRHILMLGTAALHGKKTTTLK
jgi:hypothetical protein